MYERFILWDSFVAHRIIQTEFIIFNETYCFYGGRQNFRVLAIWLSRQEVFSSLLVFSLHIRHSTFFMASNSTFILCGYISLQTKLWMIDILSSLFIQIQQMRLKTEFQRVYPLWMDFVYVPSSIFWCYRIIVYIIFEWLTVKARYHSNSTRRWPTGIVKSVMQLL